MRFASNFFNAISRACRRIDPFSLQFRLTIGVVAFAILGLGSVTLWANWEIQQILIASHEQNVLDITKVFPQDVEFYSKTMSVQAGLQTVINNRTTSNLFLWVTNPDGKVTAKSASLRQNSGTTAAMLALSPKLSKPQIYQVNERYLMLYSIPLNVQGTLLGRLYVAQDITRDQTMFMALVRGLSIATILSILVMMLVIAFYVGRSLQPLRQMSQLAGTISADDLGQARLQLERAPSEVKEFSRTFNMMLSRLSAAWEQQRQLVSDVSHELRTPLTLVYGYLQSTLRRGGNLTDAQREALEIASSEANRTIRLLQDLLDLARADSGYLNFQLEPLLLNDLVTEVVGMAQQFSEQPILLEIGTFPIEITTDPNCLRQVLLNLIDNAVKYSNPNEPITLRLDRSEENVTIQVRDRGPGIPLQYQTRIFERFYRMDEARARSTGGAGLGLAIVKTLVEGMGGSVTVRSKLGEGSTFTVNLPSQQTNS